MDKVIKFKTIRQICERDHDEVNAGKRPYVIKSGIDDLDVGMEGFKSGNLYVIVGRPAMGKTTLMYRMALNMAAEKIPVYIFSEDLPEKQAANNIICCAGYDDKVDFAKRIESEYIYICDEPALSVGDIKALMLKVTDKKESEGIVFIDYVQLLLEENEGELTRLEHEGRIVHSLKEVAADINMPVVVLSELSRAPEHRWDHRPRNEDLWLLKYGSEAIDTVIYIYRDDYYDPDLKPRMIGASRLYETELRIEEKRDDGQHSMIVKVWFDKEKGFFKNGLSELSI